MDSQIHLLLVFLDLLQGRIEAFKEPGVFIVLVSWLRTRVIFLESREIQFSRWHWLGRDSLNLFLLVLFRHYLGDELTHVKYWPRRLQRTTGILFVGSKTTLDDRHLFRTWHILFIL